VSIIEQAARRLEELRRAGIPEASLPEDLAPRAQGQTRHNTQEGIRSVEIDSRRAETSGFLTPNSPRSRLADEFRAAKHGLLVNVRGKSAAPVKRANCILVTSSVPGEGKTFAAINLAMSLAMEVDLRVLLVDADVLKPSVLDQLGLRPSKGLLDLLTEPDLSPADVILRTSVDKLSILPAGTASRHATELLASDAMTRLTDELVSYDPNRIILFDAPPLLAAPETRQLAAHAGQIVVVIEAQRTPRNAVIDALQLIKDHPVVMTLLNKVRGRAGSAYGYGGGHGYGSSHGSVSA
jgi:protein-tyrosine kinase